MLESTWLFEEHHSPSCRAAFDHKKWRGDLTPTCLAVLHLNKHTLSNTFSSPHNPYATTFGIDISIKFFVSQFDSVRCDILRRFLVHFNTSCDSSFVGQSVVHI